MLAVAVTQVNEYVHPELAFQLTRIGSLGIIVWNGAPPNDAVFEDHCRVVSEWVREGGPFTVFLNIAERFTPSANQRRIVAAHGEAMAIPSVLRIAILTESALTRSALLVLTWLTRARTIETLGFRPSEVRPALAWLEAVEPIDVEAAVAACERARVRFLRESAAAGRGA